MLTFCVSISFAQYTPMTAAGYQFKRILCDSTLHIPSFCGIPTLRNSTAKNGAIAMDTCNGKFYMWTNAIGWGQITGVGTDTTSLSNRIDQRVKYTDTAAMLLAYLRKIDTTNKWVANVTKVNDSTIRVFKGGTVTDIKILGKGTDTTSLSNRINLKLNISDTATMLSKYLRKTDTASLSNRINLKLNISDTATMLSKYLRKTDTASLSNRINLKLNISDTATMLSKYLRKTDTASLSNRINLKLNISDTTNKFVNAVTKINDTAIRIWKGTTSSVISFAKDVVYTQSPIMSKISNDSNIIYFNADTANAWRGGGTGGVGNLQQVTDVGNTTTNTLIVDDGIMNTKLGFIDYGANLIYPLRYNSSFIGSLDLIDSLNTYPPTIFGYNSTSTNPSYKIGFTGYNDKPLIDFIGVSSRLKITSQFISFSDNGTNTTTLEPIPSGYDETHYLPVNDGFNDTLVSEAPNDGQYYAYRNGNWESFTPGGGGGSTGRFGNDTATVVMAKVHNNSGVTLTNGKIVALSSSGTSSNEPAVRLANNKHDSTSANTLGFVSGSIAVNDTGWVILSGKIEKLNTSAFSNGDIIYLDSISGEWTKSKPVAPYHLVYLGVVTKANAGNGSIFVKPMNGYELDEIHDVKLTSPVNNDILAYSDTQKLWKNRNIYSIVDTTTKVATKYDLTTKQTIDTTTYYLISDFNTTSTTGANSNLTFNLGANEVRRLMIAGTCSKATSSTGLKVGIAAPTGATLKASVYGQLNTINATANSILSAINTLSGTMNTAVGTEMPFRIEGIITNGSTAGAVTLQLATVTSNTATIYAGTVMSVTKVKGL